MARRTLRAADLSDLISQAEAARIRGVSRAAITDLIRRGRLRFVKVGGRPLVFRSQVENYERGAAGRPPKEQK